MGFIVNGVNYSCKGCYHGHRAHVCKHVDRPESDRVVVRGRGRPRTASDPGARAKRGTRGGRSTPSLRSSAKHNTPAPAPAPALAPSLSGTLEDELLALGYAPLGLGLVPAPDPTAFSFDGFPHLANNTTNSPSSSPPSSSSSSASGPSSPVGWSSPDLDYHVDLAPPIRAPSPVRRVSTNTGTSTSEEGPTTLLPSPPLAGVLPPFFVPSYPLPLPPAPLFTFDSAGFPVSVSVPDIEVEAGPASSPSSPSSSGLSSPDTPDDLAVFSSPYYAPEYEDGYAALLGGPNTSSSTSDDDDPAVRFNFNFFEAIGRDLDGEGNGSVSGTASESDYAMD